MFNTVLIAFTRIHLPITSKSLKHYKRFNYSFQTQFANWLFYILCQITDELLNNTHENSYGPPEGHHLPQLTKWPS